jgi:2-C-methyl-D-erythritol 4-phosphate cytidylyltransferase
MYNRVMIRSTNHMAVVIPAAGTGQRMMHHIPKPLILLDGITILERTIRRFYNLPVYEMIVPVSENIREEVMELCAGMNAPFPLTVIYGGATRQDSVWKALQVLDKASDVVAVHDAARPLFDPNIISAAFPLLCDHAGAVAALPACHTMKYVEGNTIIETLPREKLWQINTPQVFHRGELILAYHEAYKAGFYGTDDAVLLERLGASVAVVPDSPCNIKITTQADLLIAMQILKQQNDEEC